VVNMFESDSDMLYKIQEPKRNLKEKRRMG
jgi:hypothetical protein